MPRIVCGGVLGAEPREIGRTTGFDCARDAAENGEFRLSQYCADLCGRFGLRGSELLWRYKTKNAEHRSTRERGTLVYGRAFDFGGLHALTLCAADG